MFSESSRPLRGRPSDAASAVRVGRAHDDSRPMVTVQLNMSRENSVRSYDDPAQLQALIEELAQARDYLIAQGPRPATRVPVGVGRRNWDGGR